MREYSGKGGNKSAAKTLNPLAPGSPPDLPLHRLHLSFGSEDRSLLCSSRHDGFFGGVEVLLTAKIGIVALDDGGDIITGVAYTPIPGDPTLKAGSFANLAWVGIGHSFGLK